MPFINSIITEKVSDEKKEILKSQIGLLISELPGKTEEWLFVSINDGTTLYFRGVKREKAAIVEVKIFGSQERADKERLTSKLCKLFEEELGIPGECIYVIYSEVQDGNWGWNGSLF